MLSGLSIQTGHTYWARILGRHNDSTVFHYACPRAGIMRMCARFVYWAQIAYWRSQKHPRENACLLFIVKSDFPGYNVPFICFLGSPSPIHSGRHIWKAPNANGLGLTLRGKRGERSQIMHLDQLFMEPQESTFPCFVCNLCGMTDKNNTIKQKVIALNWIREYFFLL